MSGTKSSILILGAGVYQVPAIKKAKLLGYNAASELDERVKEKINKRKNKGELI